VPPYGSGSFNAQIELIMQCGQGSVSLAKSLEEIMAWTTPEITEVCVGMEVTSYASAEI
jgi:coenzyme PQQ precursor peptide PqqA